MEDWLKCEMNPLVKYRQNQKNLNWTSEELQKLKGNMINDCHCIAESLIAWMLNILFKGKIRLYVLCMP